MAGEKDRNGAGAKDLFRHAAQDGPPEAFPPAGHHRDQVAAVRLGLEDDLPGGRPLGLGRLGGQAAHPENSRRVAEDFSVPQTEQGHAHRARRDKGQDQRGEILRAPVQGGQDVERTFLHAYDLATGMPGVSPLYS